MSLRKIYSLLIYFFLVACVNPIDFDVPPVEYQLVVDGFITDRPGPYIVSLYRARPLKIDLDTRIPVFGATVTIKSDDGEEETLFETERGTYQTSHIQGKSGNSYSIHIKTRDGALYESEPEKINPVGYVESIRYEFEYYNKLQDNIEVNADRFQIYIDSRGIRGTENYIRWRVVNTYQMETFPHLMTKANPNGPGRIPDPPECSGYVYRDFRLYRVKDCTCCICWVTDYDNVPQISDDQFVTGGDLFKNINVGTVPVTRRTFSDKYRVEVQQMSLTKKTFEYWKLVKAQKEGAASLFQPPSGKLRGNIYRVDKEEEVQGIFWAASVNSKSVFIRRTDIPYVVPAVDTLKQMCANFGSGTVRTKPSFWE